MPRIPPKTVGRLSVYRRLLDRVPLESGRYIYSHQLAIMAGVTPAQVRRDLMVLGTLGSSNRGYNIDSLTGAIDVLLDSSQGQRVALVGVGNLGRAILAFFQGRRPKLTIAAAFDIDNSKTNRVIMGCRVHPLGQLEQIIADQNIRVAIIAVPQQGAQAIADLLVDAGVRGILNFAPVPLKLPAGVHLEELDMTMSLEKVSYYAKEEIHGD